MTPHSHEGSGRFRSLQLQACDPFEARPPGAESFWAAQPDGKRPRTGDCGEGRHDQNSRGDRGEQRDRCGLRPTPRQGRDRGPPSRSADRRSAAELGSLAADWSRRGTRPSTSAHCSTNAAPAVRGTRWCGGRRPTARRRRSWPAPGCRESARRPGPTTPPFSRPAGSGAPELPQRALGMDLNRWFLTVPLDIDELPATSPSRSAVPRCGSSPRNGDRSARSRWPPSEAGPTRGDTAGLPDRRTDRPTN